MKAVGAYVFAGLFTEGMLAAGHDVVSVVEEGPFGVATARHNRPDIPVFEQKPMWPVAWMKEQEPAILYGNPPCWVGETPVITSQGVRPISEVRDGDLVLTAGGRYRRVYDHTRRFYDGALTQITLGYGRDDLLCTENHPILVRSRVTAQKQAVIGGRNRTYPTRDFGEPTRTLAKDIQVGDLLCLPKVRDRLPIPDTAVSFRQRGKGSKVYEKTNDLDLTDPTVAWALGYYVAEGWYSGPYETSVLFACHALELPEALRRLGQLGVKIRAEEINPQTPNSGKIIVNSNDLRQLCMLFNTGARHKVLPEWVQGMPVLWRREFLAGYMYGDGSTKTTSAGNVRYRAGSASRQLRDDVSRLAEGLYGTPGKWSYRLPSQTILGRPVASNGSWSWELTERTLHSHSLEDEQGIWIKVMGVSTTPTTVDIPVYNFSVEEDHTYTAGGVLGFNCAGFSMASKTRGLDSPKNMYLGYANHLGWKVKPQAFLVESVCQMFQTGDPLVQGWEAVWQALGYNTCRLWENAAHVGLPQQRKRVLFVASKANLDFYYPHHFEPVTVRDAIGDLADVPAVAHPDPWVSESYRGVPQTSYQLERRVGSAEITWHVYRKMSEAMVSLMPHLEPGQRVRAIADEIYAETYWKVAKHHSFGKPSFLNARLDWDKPCPVLTGGATYIHPDQDRFLTVRETARLQGLSDTFEFSNFQSSYDEIGKAVSPLVGRWLGEQLEEILSDPQGREHKEEVRLV